MVYMYHSFLIHSSADGHLHCFHVLAIINSVAWLLVFFVCLFFALYCKLLFTKESVKENVDFMAGQEKFRHKIFFLCLSASCPPTLCTV